MKRAYLSFLVTLTVLLCCRSASAQLGNANLYNRPTVSPYLNLLNTDRFGVSNYQTLVRPLIEQREAAVQNQANIQQLQQQFQTSQMAAARRGGGGGPRSTGHPSRYLTYLHYYPSLNFLNQRFAR
jgi:hypothetical protein